MREEKQVFWNYLSILAGQAGTALLTLLITVTTARILQPEGYGVLSIFLMVTGLISVLCVDWANSAIIRFGKEDYARTGSIAEVFWGRIILFFCCFTVATLVVFLIRGWLAGYIGINQEIAIYIVVYVFLASLTEIQLYTLQTIGRLKEYGLIPLIGKSLNLGILYGVIIFSGTFDIITVIIIVIITQILSNIVLFFLLKTIWQYPPVFSAQTIKKMVYYSWPMVFGAVSALIIGYIDTIFIKEYLTISDVGIYSIAYLGMTSISIILVSAVSLLFPLITMFRFQNRIDLIRVYMDELIPQGVFFWSLFISACMVFGSLFIPMIFGNSYSSAVIPFLVLLIGVSFMPLGSLYSGIIVSFDLMKRSVLLSASIALLNIVGDFILVPRMGILGAAIATSLSFIIVYIIYIPFMNKQLSIKDAGLSSDYPREFCFLFTLPVIPALVISLFVESIVLRILLFVVLIAVSLVVAMRAGIFKKGTVDVIQYIDMPAQVRSAIISVYRWLI